MRADVAAEVRARLGNWAFYEAASSGSAVRVWQVLLLNGDVIAVKTADGGSRGMLPAREAAVLAAVDRVTQVTGSVLASGHVADGGSWLATAWYAGTSLWDTFAGLRKDPTDVDAFHRAVTAAEAAARAVASLHATGWVHGSLQPDHILDTPDGVRLISLGHARHRRHAFPMDWDRDVLYGGLPTHLQAPEHAAARAEPAAAADVYALAGTITACASGTWPNPTEFSTETQPAHNQLLDLLTPALHPDPARRPTADDLAAELAVLTARSDPASWPEPATGQTDTAHTDHPPPPCARPSAVAEHQPDHAAPPPKPTEPCTPREPTLL